MKEKYESLAITVTEFDTEDVITTSDRNNAYRDISDLYRQDSRPVPPGI